MDERTSDRIVALVTALAFAGGDVLFGHAPPARPEMTVISALLAFLFGGIDILLMLAVLKRLGPACRRLVTMLLIMASAALSFSGIAGPVAFVLFAPLGLVFLLMRQREDHGNSLAGRGTQQKG